MPPAGLPRIPPPPPLPLVSPLDGSRRACHQQPRWRPASKRTAVPISRIAHTLCDRDASCRTLYGVLTADEACEAAVRAPDCLALKRHVSAVPPRTALPGSALLYVPAHWFTRYPSLS
eukprot:183170-Chlamydomonas_euryale.AAC.5